MKFHFRYFLHSFVKLEEDLVTFLGRSWSHFGWRKFHNGHKCSRYRKRTKPHCQNSQSPIVVPTHLFSLTFMPPHLHSHTMHTLPPHTHTWHTPLPSASPPQDRAVGSGLQSASAKRGRGLQSLPVAASHTAGGASWESEPAHWDCRPWRESRGAASLMVRGGGGEEGGRRGGEGEMRQSESESKNTNSEAVWL